MMDMTEKYIKMCKEAEEIQPRHSCTFIFHYDTGSFFYHQIAREVRTNKGTSFDKGDIYLPRQDQLQEMIPLMVNGPMGKEVNASTLAIFDNYQWEGFFSSMEQLWLAFIMKEKYGKKWDEENEKWLKAKE